MYTNLGKLGKTVDINAKLTLTIGANYDLLNKHWQLYTNLGKPGKTPAIGANYELPEKQWRSKWLNTLIGHRLAVKKVNLDLQTKKSNNSTRSFCTISRQNKSSIFAEMEMETAASKI